MITSPKEQRHALQHAMLAGTARGLDLLKRVPELMRKRGWPHDDDDLRSVLVAAVACKKLGAGRTLFRRPESAERCGGKWLADDGSLVASQIVDKLDLHDLLDPR